MFFADLSHVSLVKLHLVRSVIILNCLKKSWMLIPLDFFLSTNCSPLGEIFIISKYVLVLKNIFFVFCVVDLVIQPG